ncbi:hypothetical protein N0V83_008026 [Neocucurbitaria cava]|uniref:Uncharacterized protein n=1 Tax=Neocucurbitaria cava TaxID=798079 RepID=A0A9W9CJZ3_9PLEO|nr:hypothetical protein N0V83_008026 [Neocucurbitaria cava]
MQHRDASMDTIKEELDDEDSISAEDQADVDYESPSDVEIDAVSTTMLFMPSRQQGHTAIPVPVNPRIYTAFSKIVTNTCNDDDLTRLRDAMYRQTQHIERNKDNPEFINMYLSPSQLRTWTAISSTIEDKEVGQDVQSPEEVEVLTIARDALQHFRTDMPRLTLSMVEDICWRLKRVVISHGFNYNPSVASLRSLSLELASRPEGVTGTDPDGTVVNPELEDTSQQPSAAAPRPTPIDETGAEGIKWFDCVECHNKIAVARMMTPAGSNLCVYCHKGLLDVDKARFQVCVGMEGRLAHEAEKLAFMDEQDNVINSHKITIEPTAIGEMRELCNNSSTSTIFFPDEAAYEEFHDTKISIVSQLATATARHEWEINRELAKAVKLAEIEARDAGHATSAGRLPGALSRSKKQPDVLAREQFNKFFNRKSQNPVKNVTSDRPPYSQFQNKTDGLFTTMTSNSPHSEYKVKPDPAHSLLVVFNSWHLDLGSPNPPVLLPSQFVSLAEYILQKLQKYKTARQMQGQTQDSIVIDDGDGTIITPVGDDVHLSHA